MRINVLAAIAAGFLVAADEKAEIKKSPTENARPYLGIEIRNVNKQAPGDLIVVEATVVKVEPNSPAGKAGLKAGDIIVQVRGKAVTTAIDVVREVLRAKAGNKIILEVRRPKGNERITVKLGKRPM